MKHLLEFDPRIESHKEFCQKHFESFLEKFKKINQGAVIFKSFETDAADQTKVSFMDANIQEICRNIISDNPNAIESELTTILFQKLSQMTKTFDLIEYNTRDQSNSSLWFDMRKGRRTASRQHDIYTKVNTIARSQGAVKSPLVEKILFPEKPSVTNAAIKWGIDHEPDALKCFYAEHFDKHQEFKTEKSGLYICKDHPYIAASPDGFMSCKYHGLLPLEIKCPHNIREIAKIEDGLKYCQFLTKTSSGNITINTSHKYYTQIVSQMGITNTKQAVFIVWIPQDLFVEYIPFNKDHWEKVKTNLEVFFKIYVCPALLRLKPLTFCAKCDKVLLEENEIDVSEQNDLSSIQCDICCAWFHYKCENIKSSGINDFNIEWICSNCLVTTVTL